MAAERKPELTVTGTLKDSHGRTVKVGHRGDAVEVIVTPHSGHDGRMAFDVAGRLRFIGAWVEAVMAAERYMCQAHEDDCPNGPEPHPFRRPEPLDGEPPCCRQPWEDTSA